MITSQEINITNKLDEYLSKLKNPKHNAKSRHIFKVLRSIDIPKSSQFTLGTKAQNLGSFLSYLSSKKANLSSQKCGINFIIEVINDLISRINIALNYPISKFDNQKSDLLSLLNILDSIINTLILAKVDSGIWYCPLCWRQPAAGKHSRFCIQHMPASEYDPNNDKFLYDTAEYRSAKLIFNKAATILGTISVKNNYNELTRELTRYELTTWGQLKIKYPKKFRPNDSGSRAWEIIINRENIYRSMMIENKQSPITSCWGDTDDWKYLAKQIVKYIKASPNIRNKILISYPYKNESLQLWLDRLSSFMSNNQEFDQENEPGEIIGMLHRYQLYNYMLDLVGEIKNTKPDKNKIQLCLNMRNNGMTYPQIASALNITKQAAHKMYKKYNDS